MTDPKSISNVTGEEVPVTDPDCMDNDTVWRVEDPLFYPQKCNTWRAYTYSVVPVEAWNFDGLMGNMVIMLIVAVVSILIVVLSEAGIFQKCTDCSCKKVPAPREDIDFDDDVFAEQERLKK